MTIPLPAIVAFVAFCLVEALALWAWRFALVRFGRDLVLVRYLCQPVRWLFSFLQWAIGGSSVDDRDQGVLERAAELRSDDRIDDAIGLYSRAWERRAFRGDRQFAAEILIERALCFEKLGQIDAALRDCERGDALGKALDSSFLQVRAAYCRGLIERRRSRPSAAIVWLERARARAASTGSQRIPAVSDMTEILIALYREQGRLADAIALCRAALDDWGWNGNKYKQADVLCELAELLAETGDVKSAVRIYEQIRTMAEVIHYTPALNRVAAGAHRYHIELPARDAEDEPPRARSAQILQFPRRSASQ